MHGGLETSPSPSTSRWGAPPWRADFRPRPRTLPAHVDLAVLGGGFTGLAVAAWYGRLAPGHSVVVLEAGRLGQGASVRTGGVVLDESAAGPLPGLGNVLESFSAALTELAIDCNLRLPGCWEIARRRGRRNSPISWQDSGRLRVAHEVPGGTVDPGRLLDGLAAAAEAAGALLCEKTAVRRLHAGPPLRLELEHGQLEAEHVVLGVNGSGFHLPLWPAEVLPRFTLALATAPLSRDQLRALGLDPPLPFYTIDLPYLWGRLFGENQVIFGGGLVYVDHPDQMLALDVNRGEPARLLDSLAARVRGLHPALARVDFTHRWGGPILFALSGRPVLCRHPDSDRILVLGGYTGQGVALSVHLARWAAEALLGRRPLPPWGQPDS